MRQGPGVGGKSQKSNLEKAHRDTNNKLFALAAMLSSTICFNISKTFNADTIQDLDAIKEISERIQIRSSDSQTNQFMREREGAGRSTKDDKNRVYE